MHCHPDLSGCSLTPGPESSAASDGVCHVDACIAFYLLTRILTILNTPGSNF